MKNKIIIVLLFLSIGIFANQSVEVGIEEKLGDKIPMDLQFINSTGDTVLLKDVIKKPILLSLVYYDCPGICSPMLEEIAWTADNLKLEPNVDYQILTVSFNPSETVEKAADRKKVYTAAIKRDFPKETWSFLIGDSLNIKRLTEAVGFNYLPEGEKDYIHAGALIAIAPDGLISRYMFGTSYNPFDVKMALLEAKSGKTNPTITKVLQFCFSYDPDGRKYTLNITRILGTFMLVTVGIFFSVLVLKKKNKKESI